MPPRALTLSDELAARVTAGEPLLGIDELSDATVARAAGAVLWLLDGRGETLGTAVADPENDILRVLSRDALPSLDTDFFRGRVASALDLRRALGLVDGRSAFRLIHAEGDRLSGFVADAYGPFVVLYVYSRALVALGRLLAEAILEVFEARAVVLKLRPKGGARAGKIKQETFGEEPPEKWVTYEYDVPYEVHLLGGTNVGLFTDMRDHRRRIGEISRGKEVLNTFAYTGAFSVAAARGGARSVTSVDLASGVLKWARQNFSLSGLNPDDSRYRFETGDVLRFMQREIEGDRRFDLIILDPPTYSEAKASSWSMKKDYPELIAKSVKLLGENGGYLFLAANRRRGTRLEKCMIDGLARSGREAQVLELGGLPPDYPTAAAYPQGRFLQTALVRITQFHAALSPPPHRPRRHPGA